MTGGRIEDRRDNGYAHNLKLKEALRNAGWRRVCVTILANCETRSEAFRREQYEISRHNATDPSVGYNISRGGASTFAGLHHSDETKRRMSAMAIGKVYSAETLRRMREAHAKERIPVTGTDFDGDEYDYPSLTAAAEAIGGYPSNIRRAIVSGKSYKGLWWKLQKGGDLG